MILQSAEIRIRCGIVLAASCLCISIACRTPGGDSSPTVERAWQRREAMATTRSVDSTGRDGRGSTTASTDRKNDLGGTGFVSSTIADTDAIATVNGQPIASRRVIDVLLRANGPAILEQLIVLDEAQRKAASMGLVVTQSDIDEEYQRALKRLVDPLAEKSAERFDLPAAERALDAVLRERNVSRREFMLGMERRTYLRKIAEEEMEVTEVQLRQEFERRFGERVKVRHIQLGSLREAGRVSEMLRSGSAFVELAERYSANVSSEASGGLLDPFSMAEASLPIAFRRAGFELEEGEVSGAVQVGPWYHIIRLEERIPAEQVNFEDVRPQLEAGIRERANESAIASLYEKLFREATIVIHDPALREAFNRVHGETNRAKAP